MTEEKYKNTKIMVELTKDTMLSLFDYLHRAAGPELGKKVAQSAAFANEPIRTRGVSNPKYVGKVYLYRKEFLDKYFRNEN